jgi:hypothetical protein
MKDPKPRKPAGRKTTRTRSGDEDPVLAIKQISDADTSTFDRSDQSYSAGKAIGSDGLDGEIRYRAYEIYLARGSVEGNDLEDWLEAERSVRSRRGGGESTTQDLPAGE